MWDGKVVIVGPSPDLDVPAGVAGVVVAGSDAAAVGVAVNRLVAVGLRAAGFVGSADDEAVAQMAAELFPGAEVVPAPAPSG